MSLLEDITARIGQGTPFPKTALLAIALPLLLYTLYRRYVLPRPLPGIPCNQDALSNPLGDFPKIIRAARSPGGDVTGFLQEHIRSFNSPISQIFSFFPFNKPTVIVSDAREIEDILVRRTPKEFDRSPQLEQLFEGIVPRHQIMLSTNAEWKAHRRLLQDLMSPAFLRGTASGAIYEKVVDLISLWETKANLARGKAFSAQGDIHLAALDGVLGFSFGDKLTDKGPITNRLEYLRNLSPEQRARIERTKGEVVEFPEPELDETTKWIFELSDSVEAIRKALFKSWTWKRWRATRLKKSLELKEKFILGQIDLSVKEMEKHADKDDDESWIRSAVDHIVMRENKYAKKEGRSPDFASEMVLEETFGFVVAGHETTSTTVMWSIKILADHPDQQTKLRNALREAFPEALAQRRLLTNAEIHDTNIPYLDAAIEELLRCSPTLPINSRIAVRDTVILGHHIPKGTNVFLPGAQMHGVHIPPYAIPESQRSESSRNAKLQGKSSGEWNPEDMGEFKPERWLKTDPGGKGQHFDSMAGPNLGFGLGMRGCYGRRLAYVEMRALIVLIVWRFVLEKELPAEASGDDAVDGITRRPRKCFVRLREAY